MFKPILVDCVQDLPIVEAIEDITGFQLKVISRKQRLDELYDYARLREAISQHYVGYHPCFENHHLIKYNRPGYTDDLKYQNLCLYQKNTENTITGYAQESRYYLCTQEQYDPVIIARLISNKTLVIIETPFKDDTEYSKQIFNYYKDVAVLVNTDQLPEKLEYWDNARCLEIKERAELHYMHFTMKPLQLAVTNDYFLAEGAHKDVIYALPEDRYVTMKEADTYEDKKGNDVLKLSPTNGTDSLPNISIIILARSTEHSDKLDKVCELDQMVIKYNKLVSRYPDDKIEYIVQQDPNNLRATVESAKYELIILMAPNTIYMPFSYYAKAKLIADNDYDLVGSLLEAHYNLDQNKSSCYVGNYPHRSSIAFKRSYFLEYPEVVNPDCLLYHNRLSNTVNIAFTYNCIQIDYLLPVDEGMSTVPGEKTKGIHHKLFDWDTKTFVNKLYRVYNR